jgi:hypothetical protein
MASKVSKATCVLLLGLMGASSLPLNARADEEPTAMEGGPLIFLAAGALMLNVGATIANGAALAAGKPNRGHGMFGVVLGGASVAAGAVGLAFSGDDNGSERFSLVLAGCGLASLLTGYLNVRSADRHADGGPSRAGDSAGRAPRLVVAPTGNSRDRGWAAAVRVEF